MFTSTDTSTRPAPAALGASTLCEAFAITVQERPDQVALRTAGPDGPALSWAAYGERVRRIAAGLAARGVGRGDVVALLLTDVPEGHLVDVAALHLGAATLPLDVASSAEDLRGALRDTGPRIAITEAAFAATMAAVAGPGQAPFDVVSIDGGTGATSTLLELEAAGDPDFDLATAAESVDADDVALALHAPASTGTPSVVRHSHAGLLAHLRAVEAFAPPTLGGRVVSSLPMTDVAGRSVGHYGAVAFGLEVTCSPDAERLAETLVQVRPTRLLAGPRILEELGRAVEEAAGASPDLAAAIDKGRDTVDAIQAGCPPQFHPGVGPAAEEVLAGLRARLGLDELEWCGSPAAPSAPGLLRLLHAVGVEVLQFWGTPETILATSNPAGGAKLGTVGTPLPTVQVRLADDGEILVRGGAVAVDLERAVDDGWLPSGAHATKDYDGFLTLVDREV